MKVGFYTQFFVTIFLFTKEGIRNEQYLQFTIMPIYSFLNTILCFRSFLISKFTIFS